MHYVFLVKTFQCFSNGSEKLFCFSFLQAMLAFGKKIIIERVCASILLDKVNLSTALNDIDEFSNDWMAEFGKDVDFSLKVFKLIRFIQSFLFIDFYCYFLVCTFTDAHLHDTICTFTKLFINLIILQLLLSLYLKVDIQKLFFCYCSWLLFLF